MAEVAILHSVKLPSQKALALAFSPDFKYLAAGDRDGVIHIIDASSGVVVRRLAPPHVGFVYALAFDPDSGHLISSGKDKSIRVWNIETGEFIVDHAGIFQGVGARSMASLACRQNVKSHTLTVLDIACAGQGQMATSGQDCRVKFWKNGELVRTFDWHTAPVPCVRFEPRTQILFSASKDGTVRSWNAADGSVIEKYTGHLAGICGFEFVSEGEFLTSDERGQVIAWKSDCHSPKNFVADLGHPILCACWDGGVQALILGAPDGVVEILPVDIAGEFEKDHAPNPACLKLFKEKLLDADVRAVAVASAGRFAACDNTGKVILAQIGL